MNWMSAIVSCTVFSKICFTVTMHSLKRSSKISEIILEIKFDLIHLKRFSEISVRLTKKICNQVFHLHACDPTRFIPVNTLNI